MVQDHARGAANLRDNLDALPRAGPVAIHVFLTTAEVGDLSTLDVEVERSLAVIGVAAGPFTSPFRKGGVSAGPDSDRKTHRRLGVKVGVVGVLSEECPDIGAIDEELQLVLGPHGGIVVEAVHGAAGDGVLETIPKIGLAFAKIVAEHKIGFATLELPINLIQVIAQEHNRADDTSTGRGPHVDFCSAPEEIELGSDGGAVSLLLNRESGTQLGIVDHGVYDRVPSAGFWCLVEIEVDIHAQRGIRWASLVHGEAVCRDLSDGILDKCRRQERRGREESS